MQQKPDVALSSHHTAAQCTVNPSNAVKTPQHLSTKPVSILQHFILLPLHTRVKTKRKKVNFESHASKVQWSVGFFVIELDGKRCIYYAVIP